MGKMKDKYMDLIEDAYWLGVQDRKQRLPRMRLDGRVHCEEWKEAYNEGYEAGLDYYD